MSGELPPGWVVGTLGEIADVVGGITKGPAENDADMREVPYLRVANVQRGHLDLRELKTIRAAERDVDKLRLQVGDILFTEGGDRDKLGRGWIWNGEIVECIHQNHIFRARLRSAHIVPKFVSWYANTEGLEYFLSNAKQTTNLASVNMTTLRGLPIRLPPAGEQKRIADKLDALLARVDACRERLDRVPGILKRFRQSVLAAATNGELTREWREERGDDSELQSFQIEDAEAIRNYSFPASWVARRLSDIASIAGGVTKDSKKQSAEFTELPYLRVANVQRGYLDLSEVKAIRVPPDRVSELLLREGDILFNEGGDIDKLGRGWVWNAELPACVFQNHVFRARLRDRSFEPRYFSWYGNSRGYEYFLARGKQTTNLASINKSVLSALPVAVPPAAEQTEIVRRIEELFLLADRLELSCGSATTRVSALTSSSLAKAFRGQLVPQDPNDEPASALLARAREARQGSETQPARRKRAV